MKFAQDIVLAPVITENSMTGIADKKYTFKVATDAPRSTSPRQLKNCSASRSLRSTPSPSAAVIAARACTLATLPRARRPSSP